MKKLNSYLLTGILFVLITGTLAHFVYEWSGNNFILGFFFPVNESIREHMKLCFFPMLVWSVFADWRLRSELPCLRTALLAGILVSNFRCSSPLLWVHSYPRIPYASSGYCRFYCQCPPWLLVRLPVRSRLQVGRIYGVLQKPCSSDSCIFSNLYLFVKTSVLL